MSALPRGWAEVELAGLVEPTQERVLPAIGDERRYLGMEHVEPETTKILGSTPADGLRSVTMRFAAGDTLYGRLRPYLNKVCTPNFDGLASSEFMVFKLHPWLARGFLLYLLNSPAFVRFAVSVNEGDRPRVKWNQIARYPVQFPSLHEQERIVSAIEEQFSRLDDAEASLRRARRQLDRLRASVLSGATQDRDWPWTTIGEIAEVVGGVTKDSKRQDDPNFVEVPYLRVANVQRGYLDLTEVTTIRVSPDKAKALRLEPGDVLFNEGGDRDKLGRGWVWEGQIAECIHQNHVFRARLLNPDYEPKFVSLHGNTFGQAWFERMGKQTTNLASINLRTLKSFPLPAPPLDEQRRIAAEVERQLSILDSLGSAVDHALERSKQLRRAILERAFTGRLVPQDPSDEPASVLLERIAAERARVELVRSRTAKRKKAVR